MPDLAPMHCKMPRKLQSSRTTRFVEPPKYLSTSYFIKFKWASKHPQIHLSCRMYERLRPANVRRAGGNLPHCRDPKLPQIESEHSSRWGMVSIWGLPHTLLITLAWFRIYTFSPSAGPPPSYFSPAGHLLSTHLPFLPSQEHVSVAARSFRADSCSPSLIVTDSQQEEKCASATSWTKEVTSRRQFTRFTARELPSDLCSLVENDRYNPYCFFTYMSHELNFL